MAKQGAVHASLSYQHAPAPRANRNVYDPNGQCSNNYANHNESGHQKREYSHQRARCVETTCRETNNEPKTMTTVELSNNYSMTKDDLGVDIAMREGDTKVPLKGLKITTT